MRIIEMTVNEFGCIKDRTVRPSEKLNLIYGENESGKSTLLLFIKFMLYGLGRRSASNSERERSLSWSGKRAAGSMTLEHEGRRYRIERNFTESGRSANDQVAIISLEDGSPINTEKAPGEYFLGVPKEVFESSACVGQMRSAEINGEKTASSIENMLSSADESVDTAKILKNLDALRVTYRHKNRSGGSLVQSEHKIARLRAEVEQARDAAANLELNEQRLAHMKSDYDTAKTAFDKADALLGELNKVGVVKRFEKLRELRGELEELTKKKRELELALRHGDFVPTREHTAELKLLARSLLEAQKDLEAQKQNAEKEGVPTYDAHAAELGKKAIGAGGKELLLAKADALSKKGAARSKLALFSIIGASVFAIGAAVVMATLSPFGAFALVGTLLGIIAFCVGISSKKAAMRELMALALEYEADADNFSQRLEGYICEYEKSKSFEILKERLASQLGYAERELAEKQEALRISLLKTLDGANPTLENAAAEFKRIEGLIAQSDAVASEIFSTERMILSEEKELSGYDEAEMREALSVNVELVTPSDISEAERNRSFSAQKVRLLSDKISELESSVMIARVNAKDPLPLSDELAELSESYRRDSEFYDALTLAMESIEAAANTMRGNVTPAISREAGEILSTLSDGSYSGLLATSKFGISLEKDGYTVKSDLLSGGTRDAAYLALRLSLFSRIYGAALPPLVLDESLCQLDGKRAERMLSLLYGFADRGVQILLFTSHRREEEICNKKGIEYSKIEL